MTVAHELAARRKWKCDQCGAVDFWRDSWVSLSSLAMEEACPEDIPTLCGDECMGEFQERIKSGDVVVPTATVRGYSYKITGKRKGY